MDPAPVQQIFSARRRRERRVPSFVRSVGAPGARERMHDRAGPRSIGRGVDGGASRGRVRRGRARGLLARRPPPACGLAAGARPVRARGRAGLDRRARSRPRGRPPAPARCGSRERAGTARSPRGGGSGSPGRDLRRRDAEPRGLDRHAAALAAGLVRRGIGRGSLVAVALDRSPLLIATLLGILRAGAAFLPLDPAYPPARVRMMLEDAGSKSASRPPPSPPASTCRPG